MLCKSERSFMYWLSKTQGKNISKNEREWQSKREMERNEGYKYLNSIIYLQDENIYMCVICRLKCSDIMLPGSNVYGKCTQPSEFHLSWLLLEGGLPSAQRQDTTCQVTRKMWQRCTLYFSDIWSRFIWMYICICDSLVDPPPYFLRLRVRERGKERETKRLWKRLKERE